jgi:hypothetical protein
VPERIHSSYLPNAVVAPVYTQDRGDVCQNVRIRSSSLPNAVVASVCTQNGGIVVETECSLCGRN